MPLLLKQMLRPAITHGERQRNPHHRILCRHEGALCHRLDAAGKAAQQDGQEDECEPDGIEDRG